MTPVTAFNTSMSFHWRKRLMCALGLVLLMGWHAVAEAQERDLSTVEVERAIDAPLSWPQASSMEPVASVRIPADGMSERVLACTICHGQEGKSTPLGYFPRIAGKPEGYLYEQLLSFQEGRRSYPAMSHLLTVLSDEVLHAMAAHFAALDLPYPPPPPIQQTAAQQTRGRILALHGDTQRGVPACAACHGQGLTGVLPAVPGLLGLPRDYLNGQLGAWRNAQRHGRSPDCMAEIVRRLQPQDIADVSGWLATQPVPAFGKPIALAVHAKHFPQPPLMCGIWERRRVHANP